MKQERNITELPGYELLINSRIISRLLQDPRYTTFAENLVRTLSPYTQESSVRINELIPDGLVAPNAKLMLYEVPLETYVGTNKVRLIKKGFTFESTQDVTDVLQIFRVVREDDGDHLETICLDFPVEGNINKWPVELEITKTSTADPLVYELMFTEDNQLVRALLGSDDVPPPTNVTQLEILSYYIPEFLGEAV